MHEEVGWAEASTTIVVVDVRQAMWQVRPQYVPYKRGRQGRHYLHSHPSTKHLILGRHFTGETETSVARTTTSSMGTQRFGHPSNPLIPVVRVCAAKMLRAALRGLPRALVVVVIDGDQIHSLNTPTPRDYVHDPRVVFVWVAQSLGVLEGMRVTGFLALLVQHGAIVFLVSPRHTYPSTPSCAHAVI